MGITGGAMTVRRFRVEGVVPEGYALIYPEKLAEFSFKEPEVEVGKEETEGWVSIHNLLDTDFSDINQWLFTEYAVLALRSDKKSLPAKLFAATLEKRCEAWARENARERCPASVKAELKDNLEAEWLKRTLPRVSVTEAVWNIPAGYLLLHSLSDGMMDRFRKRFHATFGLELVPCSPLDWSDSQSIFEALLNTSPALLHGGHP